MTYRELLNLYKKDELEAEQKQRVEADIEKQEAISDFLYEKDDIPTLTAIFGENDCTQDEDVANAGQEREFMRMVRQSIRRAFVKMGIVTSAVALVILLLIQFVLPEIVSAFYYNPGKEVAENTNQMSLDMAVYTELLVPQYIRYNVNVDDLGYGNYDFRINQNDSYNGVFTAVTGRIERDRMIMYDPNALKRPVSNAFALSLAYENPSRSMSELEEAGQVSMAAAGFSEDNLSQLNALSDDDEYVAYVTLEKLMDYSPFVSFLQKNDIILAWCAVCTNWNPTTSTMLRPDNIGFQYGPFSTNLRWNKERYPELMLHDVDVMFEDPNLYYQELAKNIKKEDFMLTHLTSMLRYMSDQNKFLKMMELDSKTFTSAADYVEENGLLIYGFSIVADKEQLLNLVEQEEVYLIYTQPLR